MCQKSFFFTFLQFFVFWAWRIFSSMSSHRRVLRTSAWIPQRSAKIGNSLSQHVCLLHVGTGLYKTWEQCLALVHLNFGSTLPCFQHSQILLCHLKHEPFWTINFNVSRKSSDLHRHTSQFQDFAGLRVAFKNALQYWIFNDMKDVKLLLYFSKFQDRNIQTIHRLPLKYTSTSYH